MSRLPLPADDPVGTLAELQRLVDRLLGDEPRVSDTLMVVAVLRTIADMLERRVMGSGDAPTKTPPTA